MGYSDYGGYAYRNGDRVEERSDAVIGPDGIRSTPGSYPGFDPALKDLPKAHALLGEGPLYLALYKQTAVTVYENGVEVDPKLVFPREFLDLLEDEADTAYLSVPGDGTVVSGTHNGATFKIAKGGENGNILCAEMEEADGTVLWTGFSGFSIGAGHDEEDWEHDVTVKCERALRAAFEGSGS